MLGLDWRLPTLLCNSIQGDHLGSWCCLEKIVVDAQGGDPVAPPQIPKALCCLPTNTNIADQLHRIRPNASRRVHIIGK